jgi:hypothetical protein
MIHSSTSFRVPTSNPVNSRLLPAEPSRYDDILQQDLINLILWSKTAEGIDIPHDNPHLRQCNNSRLRLGMWTHAMTEDSHNVLAFYKLRIFPKSVCTGHLFVLTYLSRKTTKALSEELKGYPQWLNSGSRDHSGPAGVSQCGACIWKIQNQRTTRSGYLKNSEPWLYLITDYLHFDNQLYI